MACLKHNGHRRCRLQLNPGLRLCLSMTQPLAPINTLFRRMGSATDCNLDLNPPPLGSPERMWPKTVTQETWRQTPVALHSSLPALYPPPPPSKTLALPQTLGNLSGHCTTLRYDLVGHLGSKMAQRRLFADGSSAALNAGVLFARSSLQMAEFWHRTWEVMMQMFRDCRFWGWEQWALSTVLFKEGLRMVPSRDREGEYTGTVGGLRVLALVRARSVTGLRHFDGPGDAVDKRVRIRSQFCWHLDSRLWKKVKRTGNATEFFQKIMRQPRRR